MSTYEAGTVAVATVRGVPNVRVMRVDDETFPWVVDTGHRQKLDEVTDIRPLVVLDLTHLNYIEMAGLASDLRSCNWPSVASQIEARTKPPRIPEPGLWGVVKANRRELDGRTDLATGTWVRVDVAVCPWQHTDGGWTADWKDLVDPTLVRDGIEDES